MVKKTGPQSYLTNLEERELGVLKECAGIGRRDVMWITQCVAKEKGLFKKPRITHCWWSHFLQSQGDLSLTRGDSTAHSRMGAMNKETLSQSHC